MARLCVVVVSLLAVLLTSSLEGQRRRAVAHRPPKLELASPISVSLLREVRGCVALNHILAEPAVPASTTVEWNVYRPDGQLYATWFHDQGFTGVAKELQGFMLHEIPADWTPGLATAVTRVMVYGVTYTYSAKIPVGMPPETPDDGPLKDAIVNEWGGVQLSFHQGFELPPVVMAPTYLNQLVKLGDDGTYIPPGVIGHGQTLITTCARRSPAEGQRVDPFTLVCSSVWRDLP